MQTMFVSYTPTVPLQQIGNHLEIPPKYMGDFDNTNGKQYYRGDIVKTQVPTDNMNANFDRIILSTAYYVAKEDLTVDLTGGTINGNPGETQVDPCN